MPRMSGRELLARLRADGADVPVALTSGHLDHTQNKHTEAQERVIYLPKP